MNDQKRPFFGVAVFVVTLVSVGFAGGFFIKPGDASVADLKKQVAGLKEEMNACRTSIDQQTDVLDRAFGKQVPVRLPDATKKGIKELEEVIQTKEKWPGSSEKAEELRKELARLLKTIPPWAEEDFLPRIAVIRWAVEAIWVIRKNEGAENEKLEITENALKDLLEHEADDTPADLQKWVKENYDRAKKDHGKIRLQDALKKAQLALIGKGDFGVAIAALEEFGEIDAAKKPRDDLRAKFAEKAAADRIHLLQSTLERCQGFDTRLRQAGFLRVQDATVNLIIDLETDQPRPEQAIKEARSVLADCERKLEEIGSKQQEEVAKKVRNYQAWALRNILRFDGPDGWYYDNTLPWIREQFKAFRKPEKEIEIDWPLFKTFPSTKALMEEKIGVDLSGVKGSKLSVDQQKEIYNAAYAMVGWKANIDQEIAYRTTRDGMVAFLIPINVNLLDPPVAQLYHKAFQKGWQKLEGRDDQLSVAKECAKVTKAGLD